MPIPYHLTESDYPKGFPPSLDVFAHPINEEHYIDAWIINSAFNSLKAVEQYLIDHMANITAPVGDDVVGEEGSLIISIPPACYPSYKFAMAWDSQLLAENIKQGVNIFGIEGTCMDSIQAGYEIWISEGLLKGRQESVGLAWADLGQRGAETYIFSLAYLGNGIAIAGTYPSGKIFRSTDYGATWADLGQRGAETYIYSLAYLGNGIAIAGTGLNGKIFRSS